MSQQIIDAVARLRQMAEDYRKISAEYFKNSMPTAGNLNNAVAQALTKVADALEGSL